MIREEEDQNHTREMRPRPFYKQTMKMFSPTQTGIPPRPNDIDIRRSYIDSDQLPLQSQTQKHQSNQPRSKSSFGAVIPSYSDYQHSTNQSALSKFADNRSSRSKLSDHQKIRHHTHHQRQKSSYDSRNEAIGNQQKFGQAVSSLLHQSRSNSNVLQKLGASHSRSSISGRNRLDGKSDDGKQSQQLDQAKNSRQRSSKIIREYPQAQRTLKDCKNELKQDRLHKAKMRRSSRGDVGKRKSRSKKLPEVVVVYRYPQSSQRTSSAEKTPQSSTYVSDDISMNALHQQLQRQYSDDQIEPFFGRSGIPPILSSGVTTSQRINPDSSVPISPSDLYIPNPSRGNVVKEKRKRSDESLTESAEQIIKKYLRQEKVKQKKDKRRKSASSKKDKHRKQYKSKSRQSTKMQHDTESTQGGIIPYTREESSKLLAPPPPMNPLTSSELADSYLEPKRQQFQKRSNGPFLYYQQQKERSSQAVSAVLSSRPQEVIITEKVVKADPPRPSYQQSSDAYVSIDSRQFSNDSSAKYNLVTEYQNIIAQQEMAYKLKIQELQSIKYQVQHTASQLTKVHERRKSRDRQRKSLSSKRSRNQSRRSMSSQKQQRSQLHTQASVEEVREEERSTEKRSVHQPRSKLGQNYINYLQRNQRAEQNQIQRRSRTKSNEEDPPIQLVEQTQQCDGVNQPAVIQRVELLQEQPIPQSQPQVQRRLSPKRLQPYRQKSLDNVKQYAISKIIGRLNTVKELQRIDKVNEISREAKQQAHEVHSRYEQAAEKMLITAPSVHSSIQLLRDDSKSSFIHRFQKFHRREVSKKYHQEIDDLQQSQQRFTEKRSHSHIDLQRSKASYHQSRAELIPETCQPEYYYQPSAFINNHAGKAAVQNNYYDQEQQQLNHQGQEQQQFAVQAKPPHYQPHHQNTSVSTYYTLGQEQLSLTKQDEVPQLNTKVHEFLNLPYPHQSVNTNPTMFQNLNTNSPPEYQRQSSPLRNAGNNSSQQQLMYQQNQQVISQTDFDAKMDQASQMQELMSRADLALHRSSEQLSLVNQNKADNLQSQQQQSYHMMTGFNISQESTIVENNQRQEQQYEEGKAAGHNFTASQHFSHRIAELQRQTTEVQKLPEFYNERVMSLRKRTLELQEAAGTYTSGEGEQPQYQLTSSAVSGCKDQNQEWRQENQAYVIRCEDQERRVSFHNQDENAKSPQYINTIEVENKLARMHGNECDSTMVRHLDVSQNCYLRQEGERQNLSPNENVVSMNYTAAHSRLQSIGQGGEHSYRPEQSYQNHTNEKDQYMTQTEDYVDTNQLNSTTRNQELQRAQIKNHQDLLGGGRPHHIQVLSQEITMAHNKRDHDEHLDRNSFELTKKLDAQAYSHGTYRGPHTVYTMTTEKAEENPNINDERKNRNKERRRQKREHKLQKLKELHDQAQYSMTQIASGLSSQAASVYQSSHRDMTDEGHGNIAALSPMSGLINLNAQQEVEETSRVKSTVQKLANTRKEIKKLIKIQNKHSKLLRQLQKSGVVKPTESQDGLHQESQASNLTMSEMSVNQKQFQMAQSTNLLRQMQDIFKYLAQIQEKLDFEIEERKMRTGQLLGNTNQTSSAMPLQMPATQSNLGQNNSCYEDDSLQQQQQQHPQHLHTQQNSQNQQFFGQFQQPGINSQQQSLQHGIVTSNQKNNSLSQGTTSTLFWDTQMAYNNNAMFGTAGLNNVNAIANPNPPILISQNQQQQQQLSDFHKNEMATSGRLQSLIHIQPLTQENSDVRTTQSDRDSFKGQKDQKGFSTAGFNNRNSIQQQTASLTQKTESDELNSSILLGGNASSQQNLHQLTNKVTDRTLTVTSDQLQKSSQMPAKLPPQYNNCASSETTAILSQTANTNMSLNGIRVDQLCEILSREIGRVREESVQQAHDMRYQYEVELQQLRQEFHQSSSTNNLHNGVTIGKDSNKIIMDQSQFQQQHHLQQNSSNKDLVQQRQMELFNCDGSSNIDQTQRTDPGSQQLTTQRQPQHYQHQQYPMMTMPTNDQSQTHFQQMLMQPPQINSHQNIQMLLQEQQNNQNMVMNDEEQEEVVEEPHQMPHTVFEELEKVKAERDAYYEKLMRVRNRISQAKGLANNGIVNSSTERTENSPAMSGQMPMQMQLQMQVQGFIDTNDMSAYENVEADQPARPNQASNYIQTTTNEGTGTFVDTTKGTQELRQQLQNYNTDFNIYPQHHLPQQHDFSDLAKKQQLNNQQTYHSLESNIPSHFAISQQQKHLKGEQQRSATQDISIIDTQQNYPVNMTSTSQTVKQESLEGLNGGNGQQNNRNAGKIVHQFRTFQLDNTISTNNNQQQRDNSVGTGSRTSKTRNGNEIEKCRKPGKYLNVRHNRTSLLRQNKVARERGTNIDTTSIGPKCSSCLMSSSEVGAGGSQERSFKSNRSSTSQTRKVGGNMHNIGAMSTLGGGRESSNECTMCHGKLGASKMTTPFINESVGGVDPNILMMVNSGQSSASNRKVMALQQRRSRTPNNDNLTFSNNANSTFSSQGLTMEKHQESHALPSRAIGGRHTIQTMIPRSPDLIGRLAAEHEQLYVNASAQESLEQMQQNQQTGGSINEQHSESRALQVIQHYLEKYDKH